MTYLERVSWLRGYIGRVLEMQDVAERIILMRARAERITAQLSPAPGGGGDVADKIQKCVEDICELEQRYADVAAENVKKLIEIEDAIEALDNREYRLILRKRYIDGAGVRRIAEDLNFSERHLRRMHYDAVMAVKIPEFKKDVRLCP